MYGGTILAICLFPKDVSLLKSELKCLKIKKYEKCRYSSYRSVFVFSTGKKSKRKQSQRKKKKKEIEKEQPEPNEHEAVNTEKEDKAEDVPVKSDISKPVEKKSFSTALEPSIYFSDDDEDMNVNFDIDIDTDDDDDDRNEEIAADGRSNSSGTKPRVTDEDATTEVKKSNKDGDGEQKNTSPDEHSADEELAEAMDIDTENHVEEDYDEDDDWMDVDSNASAPTLNEGKLNLVKNGFMFC